MGNELSSGKVVVNDEQRMNLHETRSHVEPARTQPKEMVKDVSRRKQPMAFATAFPRRHRRPAPPHLSSSSSKGGSGGGGGGDNHNYTIADIHSTLHAHLPAMPCDGIGCANAAEKLFVYFAGDGDVVKIGDFPIPPELLFYVIQQFKGSWDEDTLPTLMTFLETNRLFRQILIEGHKSLRSFASMTFTLNQMHHMFPNTTTWNYPNRWLLNLGKVRFILYRWQDNEENKLINSFHRSMDTARLLANLPNNATAPYEVALTFPNDFIFKGTLWQSGGRTFLYSGGGDLVLNGNGKRHTVWKVTRVEMSGSYKTRLKVSSVKKRLWLPTTPDIANIEDLVIVRASMPEPLVPLVNFEPAFRFKDEMFLIVPRKSFNGAFGHRIGAFWKIMPQLRVLKLDASKEQPLKITDQAWKVNSFSVVPQMSRALYGISQGGLSMSPVLAAAAEIYKMGPYTMANLVPEEHQLDVPIRNVEDAYLRNLAYSNFGVDKLRVALYAVIVAVGNRVDALLSAVSTPRVTPDGLNALNTLELKAAAGLAIDEFMHAAPQLCTRADMIAIFNDPINLEGGQFLMLDHERPGFKAIAAGAGLARLENLEVSGINVLVDNEFFGGGKRFSTRERVDTGIAVGRFRDWVADMKLVAQQIQFLLTAVDQRPLDTSSMPISRKYRETFSGFEEKLSVIKVQIEKDAAPATLPSGLREIRFHNQMVSDTFFQSLANDGVVAATPLPRSRFHRLKALSLIGVKTSRLDELFNKGGVFWNAIDWNSLYRTMYAANFPTTVDMVTDSTPGVATFEINTPLDIFANPLVKVAHLTDATLLCLANDESVSPIRQSRALDNLEVLKLRIHPHFTAVGLTPVAKLSYPFLRRLALSHLGHHESKGTGPDYRQMRMEDGDRGFGKVLARPWAPLGEAIDAFFVRGATWALVHPDRPPAQRKESTLHYLSLSTINLTKPVATAAPMDTIETTVYWRTLLMLDDNVDIDSDDFQTAQEQFVATMAMSAELIAAHAAEAKAKAVGGNAYIRNAAVRRVIEGGRALRDEIADKSAQTRDAIWQALEHSLCDFQRETRLLQNFVAPLVILINDRTQEIDGDDVDGIFKRTKKNARARDTEDAVKTFRRILAPAISTQLREIMLVGIRGLNDRPGIFYPLILTGMTQPVLSNLTNLILGGQRRTPSLTDMTQSNLINDHTGRVVLSFMDFYALFISSGGLPNLLKLTMASIGIFEDDLRPILDLFGFPTMFNDNPPPMLPKLISLKLGLFHTYTQNDDGQKVFATRHVSDEFARELAPYINYE